jgi:hypothetical protein
MEKANVRNDENGTHWCAIGIYDILDLARLRASRPRHDFQPDCMVTAQQTPKTQNQSGGAEMETMEMFDF